MSPVRVLEPLRAGLLAGLVAGVLAAALALFVVGGSPAAYAAEPKVDLGTAGSFSVLAGSTVTNTGPTTLVTGNLGVSPGSAITGFPPGVILAGEEHAADADALQAQNDLTTAYNDAAGRTATATISSDLGGRTLVGGVYESAEAMALTGTVTLDAEGDPNTVFIFQAGSTLTTATGSTVALVNGAQACNVFWQVGSSATLRTNTTFNGTVLALTSITLETGTTVVGRLLARNGAVTLDTNTVTQPGCRTAPTGTTTSPGGTTTGPGGGTTTGSGSAGGSKGPSSSTGTSTSTSGTGSPPAYAVPEGRPDTGRDGTRSAPRW